MDRLDRATTDLIEQDVRGRFPEGVVDSVVVLQYGDDPAVEPGQAVVQVTGRIRGRSGRRRGGSAGDFPPGPSGHDPAAPARYLRTVAAG